VPGILSRRRFEKRAANRGPQWRSGIGAIPYRVGVAALLGGKPAGAPAVLTGRAVSDDFGITDSCREWMTLAKYRQRGHSRAMPPRRIGMFTPEDSCRSEVAGHGNGLGIVGSLR